MAEAWAAKNSWFGQDRAMTYTAAFEIHKDLVDKEGYDPKSDEYYAERLIKESVLTFRINLLKVKLNKRPTPFRRWLQLKEA